MPARELSRRAFLAKASATVAVPTIIPATALGLGGRPAPSARLAIAGIGVGGNGGGHLSRYLGSPETQVVAVCEIDSERREAARQKADAKYAEDMNKGSCKGCAAYGDFRELIARDDIDAVWISTPDHWHALIAIAAMREGKDVYCEKPLSLTIHEAREMAKTARRYDRVFQTGSQQRSSFRFWRACELVRNGRIGKLISCHVNVGGPSTDCYLPAQPVPEGLDWNMWLGPAPWRPYNKGLHPASWRGYRDYSGGGMTDWGAHHFDICQWALGMDNSGPVEIIPPDDKDVKWLTYRYANGVLVHRGGYTGPGSGITFKGTDGMIEVSRSHLLSEPKRILDEPIAPGEVRLYHSNNHAGDWLNCIKTRERPICDVEIGCRSVTVCHLGNIAYWLKRPLRWNPQTERFDGDREADRWLDRPKRAPWVI